MLNEAKCKQWRHTEIRLHKTSPKVEVEIESPNTFTHLVNFATKNNVSSMFDHLFWVFWKPSFRYSPFIGWYSVILYIQWAGPIHAQNIHLDLASRVSIRRRCYTRQFFAELVSQRLKAWHCSCTNSGVTLCNGTASNSQNCDRGGPRRVFWLADRAKHCETSCTGGGGGGCYSAQRWKSR